MKKIVIILILVLVFGTIYLLSNKEESQNNKSDSMAEVEEENLELPTFGQIEDEDFYLEDTDVQTSTITNTSDKTSSESVSKDETVNKESSDISSVDSSSSVNQEIENKDVDESSNSTLGENELQPIKY